MQAFSAQWSTPRTGGVSARSDNPAAVKDDGAAPDGFDRMLQSRDTPSEAPARPQEPKATAPKARQPARDDTRPASQDDASAKETRSDTAQADSAPADSEAPADDSAADDARAPSPMLPEQLLAMLNGLTAATPAPAEAAPPVLPTELLSARAAATTPANRPLPTTLQPLATAAPAPAEGDTTAFALAMAATSTAATVDADVDNVDVAGNDPLNAAPLATSNTANGPTLTRIAAPAVPAQPPVPLDAGFDDGFGSRIAWLAEQRVGHAEIRVSPDHLGTIDVRLQLDGNRVNAEFNSAQAEVRHALESSLPRLREMLGQQGLQLGHAGVGQQSSGQAPSDGRAARRDDRAESGAETIARPATLVRATRGLLDEYA